jgi:hypothetical protein
MLRYLKGRSAFSANALGNPHRENARRLLV